MKRVRVGEDDIGADRVRRPFKVGAVEHLLMEQSGREVDQRLKQVFEPTSEIGR